MTAVEHLINELSDIIGPIEATNSGELLLVGTIKRAKEMEREQREKDFIEGYKKRAEIGNSIFDEISETTAKVLFEEMLKSE